MIRIIIVTIIERLNGHVPTESQRLCVCALLLLLHMISMEPDTVDRYTTFLHASVHRMWRNICSILYTVASIMFAVQNTLQEVLQYYSPSNHGSKEAHSVKTKNCK